MEQKIKELTELVAAKLFVSEIDFPFDIRCDYNRRFIRFTLYNEIGITSVCLTIDKINDKNVFSDFVVNALASDMINKLRVF